MIAAAVLEPDRRSAGAEQAAERHESRLLAAARAGDSAAFAELIRSYDRPLRALVFRLLEDASAMDDVLQDSYVKAYRSLRGFTGDARFGTWLYRIVYNTCLDELRRRARHPHVPLESVPDRRDPVDLASAVSTRTTLARALASLPAELRAVALLVDAEGMSYDEAGEILGLPPGTVASRLHRARAVLRPALSSDSEGGRR